MKQSTFASLAFDSKKKTTRRERFLQEMEAVVAWDRLLRIIEPHYPRAGGGRQPMPLETMRRIYFLQQWFNLSDPGADSPIPRYVAWCCAFVKSWTVRTPTNAWNFA